MTRPLTFFLPIVLLFCATHADAQPAEKPQPPPGPLLASAPDFSQWVITFAYPSDKPSSTSSSAPAPIETRTRTITTTKTGDIVHEETVSGSGYKVDVWHIKDAQYFRVSGAKQWFQATPTGANGYSPLPASGFRDLDWITASAYEGTIQNAGRNCLVFAPGAPSGFKLSNPETFKTLAMYALIDAESRLPVLVQIDSTTRLYRFADSPTEKLRLPPDLAQVLKQGEEMRARASQPPPRPY